jgi:hypothetical protein
MCFFFSFRNLKRNINLLAVAVSFTFSEIEIFTERLSSVFLLFLHYYLDLRNTNRNINKIITSIVVGIYEFFVKYKKKKISFSVHLTPLKWNIVTARYRFTHPLNHIVYESEAYLRGGPTGPMSYPFPVFYTLFIIIDPLIFQARAHGEILEYQYIMIIWYHRLNRLALLK